MSRPYLRWYLLLAGLLVWVFPALAQPVGTAGGRAADVTATRAVDALNDSAAVLTRSAPGRARRLAHEAYRLAHEHAYRVGQAAALDNLADVYRRQDVYGPAIALYRQAASFRRRLSDPIPLAGTLLRLASMQKEAGRYDASEAAYREALAIYTREGDEAGMAQAYYDTGLLYWDVGRLEDAVAPYEAALRIWERLGNKTGVARSLNNIGVIFYHWAGYRQALVHYNRSLDLRKETGDAHGAALVLNNIGKTYQDWGQHERAREAYEEAYTYARLDTTNALGYTLASLASMHAAAQDYDRALAYYRQAEAVYRGLVFHGGVVESLVGRAKVYAELGDLATAEAILVDAAAQARAGHLVVIEATVSMELGRVVAAAGDHRRAVELFEQSLAAGRTLNARHLAMENYRLLSASYQALGDHERALHYYQRYAAQADSIFGERSDRLLSEVEARYESERRARQIVLLEQAQDRQRHVTLGVGLSLVLVLIVAGLLFRANVEKRASNRQLVEVNRQLQRERDEHKVLLQILCHDLANPLGTIHGCLQVILDDPTAREEFGVMAQHVARQGIDIIELVREMQVLERDRLTVAPVALHGAVEDAALVLRHRFEEKHLSLHVDVAPELAVWAEPRSLANSVVANLLTNAIKFSTAGGAIYVRAYAERDEVVLAVRDDGIGIPAELRPTLFDMQGGMSRPGTAGEGGSGFGLLLVKKFADLYGAAVDVDSTEVAEDPAGHGTEIRLRFRPAVLPPAPPRLDRRPVAAAG